MKLILGNPKASVVVVGDAVHPNDWRKGQPTHPDTWGFLLDFLAVVGITADEVCYVPCFWMAEKASGATLTAAQLQADAEVGVIPFLKSHPRKVVLALGNNAICSLGVSAQPKDINKHRARRLSSDKLPGIEITASISPYAMAKDPDTNASDVLADLRFAKRLYDKDFTEQTPHTIVELDTVASINELITGAKKFPKLAYDTETTGLNPLKDIIVTYGFYRGEKNALGEKIGYFWAGFDKLRQRYEDNLMTEFYEAFIELFSSQGNGGPELVLWNAPFDHGMVEANLLTRLPFPKHDAMLKKWVVNKHGDNRLKTNTTRYLGYSDYEAAVTEAVAEISARRGRIMYRTGNGNEDDFEVLDWYGITPEPTTSKPHKTKGQGYRWPDTAIIDKKACTYAMLDFDILTKYQVLDAIYTYDLDEILSEEIDACERLTQSNNLRHKIAENLFRATQRGLVLDTEVNRGWSAELEGIIAATSKEIETQIQLIKPGLQGFNPNSTAHLSSLLYGDPVKVPYVDLGTFVEDGYNKWSTRDKLDALHEEFYGDCEELKGAIRSGDFDYDFAKTELEKLFREHFSKYKKPVPIKDKPMWVKGLYEPDPEGFTKTGRPGCGRVLLENLYKEKPLDILQYILLRSKASKIKSTFVDGIFTKIDENDVLHGQYKATGTKTGRVSSCVDADTLITTQRGEVRIVDLIVGQDAVLTHKGNFKTVTDLIDKGPGEMVELELENGRTVQCTLAHRVLTLRGWVAVGKLVEDDEIVINCTV